MPMSRAYSDLVAPVLFAICSWQVHRRPRLRSAAVQMARRLRGLGDLLGAAALKHSAEERAKGGMIEKGGDHVSWPQSCTRSFGLQ